MFTEKEIGVPNTLCNSMSAVARAIQQTRTIFEKLAQGEGMLFRFRLTAALTAGSSAPAMIRRWENGAFTNVEAGTVHDEEPGGYWEGEIGDEGWCTGRDGQDGNYSIVFMPVPMETIIQDIVDNSVSSAAAKTGGYSHPVVTSYAVGTHLLQWNTFSPASDAIYAVDTDSPKTKLHINAPGTYLLLFQGVFCPSAHEEAHITITPLFSGVSGGMLTQMGMYHPNLSSFDNSCSFFALTTVATTAYIQLQLSVGYQAVESSAAQLFAMKVA